MNRTDGHVVVDNNSMLLANRSRLKLLACCFVVRLGRFGCIFYVIHALIEYLTRNEETTKFNEKQNWKIRKLFLTAGNKAKRNSGGGVKLNVGVNNEILSES